MWHSRALALAAVAAVLLAGAGCVTRSTYERDLATKQAGIEAESLKSAVLQEKLDQANRDVKKAWLTLAEKATDYTANQKATDDARRQVANLKQQVQQIQNSAKDAEKNTKAAADKAEKASKDQADQLKKLQDQLDAAQKDVAALRDLTEKQKAQIAELMARLEKNNGEKNPVPAPPVQPTTVAPPTSAPAPAGT